MRLFFSFFLLMSMFNLFSQEIATSENISKSKIDSLYREDQFYFGFSYNILQKKPSGLSQSKVSTGFSTGFVRDVPINKNRTIAIASGIGFTYNNYNQNIAITEQNQTPIYAIIDSKTSFNKNKFSQLLVDIPVEFRWRTSTYESHKFWRIYGGFKFSYLLFDKSIFDSSQGKIVIKSNNDFNKFLYGIYISSGYNTWNVYAYYGLNPLFKSAKINTVPITIQSLNIGIIFYIL